MSEYQSIYAEIFSFGNYGNDSDIQQKIAADGNWIYEHSVRDVYDDGRGDFYDGMTNEDYAACQTRFAPELKQAQAKADEEAAKEAKKAQEKAARFSEAARLADIAYFQHERIKVSCKVTYYEDKACDDSATLTVTEPLDSKSRPSQKQLACILAKAKFQYSLFNGGVLVQTMDRDPSNEVTGLGTKSLYVVIANPWPQDFTAPAGCEE